MAAAFYHVAQCSLVEVYRRFRVVTVSIIRVVSNHSDDWGSTIGVITHLPDDGGSNHL